MINFFTKKNNSPFAKDTSTLFLPIMMLFMVFMATLSLGIVMSVNSMTNHWNKSLSGSLTIQIPPNMDETKDYTDTIETKVETALIILRETDNVKEAHLLSEEEMKSLLEPWLGKTEIVKDIPLPKLIDVKLKNSDIKTIEAIDEILKKYIPEASLDSHRAWTSKLSKLIGSLKFLSFLALYLIVGATMFTVIYATRSSLAVHKPVISLLHLIGAKDTYISMQYAKRTFVLAFVGGLLGFIIAAPALVLIGSLAANLGGGPLASLHLETNEWLIMVCIPFSTAILSMLTAYFTVQRDLLRML